MNIFKWLFKPKPKPVLSKNDKYYYKDGRVFTVIDFNDYQLYMLDNLGQMFVYNKVQFLNLVENGYYSKEPIPVVPTWDAIEWEYLNDDHIFGKRSLIEWLKMYYHPPLPKQNQ